MKETPTLAGDRQNRGLSSPRSTSQGHPPLTGRPRLAHTLHAPLPAPHPSTLALQALRVVLVSQQSGVAGVILIHAVENCRLVFWKLAVAQV